MSAKWVRVKAWDDQHLTGPLWPVKAILRLFSSVYFGVAMLVLVSLYGVLASVPVGLIALAPTWFLYALTLVLAIVLAAAVPIWLLLKGMSRAGISIQSRFAAGLIIGLALAIASVVMWWFFLWPRIRFDPIAHTGFRLLGDFVDRYKSIQARRLPMLEMSELEFYSWWPLKLVLILFVVNMVVATLRRIEFRFPYIGVIMVHTGIVVIALGSVYYAGLKQEGDMILTGGELDSEGKPIPGTPETGFYDNTIPALWLTQDPTRQGWEFRPLRGVPRYNDYNLDVVGGPQLGGSSPAVPDLGPISVSVPVPDSTVASGRPRPVDADLGFRIVGYSAYGDLATQWVASANASAAEAARTIEAYLKLPPDPGSPDRDDPSRPRATWRLLPDRPPQRVEMLSVQGTDVLGLEYTRGMSEQRWKDLSAPIPKGTQHALVIRHPASGFESVYPIKPGNTLTVGNTGYVLEVVEISAKPPFPIITKGYQGAQSSVAVVRVRPPVREGQPAGSGEYQRWVYHRYPEISQDMLAQPATGMPARRNADPDLQISYIDASVLQVYFDEAPDGNVRTLVRLPGGQATVTASVAEGGSVEVAPGFTLKLASKANNLVPVERPVPTPLKERETRFTGNHQRAAIAVEISAGQSKQVVWIPFAQYTQLEADKHRTITLPDGRQLTLAFSRLKHTFWPPMSVQLADFWMTPYPHSRTPRDYRSELLVNHGWKKDEAPAMRRTSLNEPLLERTPYVAAPGTPALVAAVGRIFSLVAPNQYKFSQAGWDQSGWMQTLEESESTGKGRPVARFTILGVGNNPGIYIIATGAVMMSVGIPWAFYLKPWLVRRQKVRIQREIASGVRPVRIRSSTNGQPHESTANEPGESSPEPVSAETKP